MTIDSWRKGRENAATNKSFRRHKKLTMNKICLTALTSIIEVVQCPLRKTTDNKTSAKKKKKPLLALLSSTSHKFITSTVTHIDSGSSVKLDKLNNASINKTQHSDTEYTESNIISSGLVSITSLSQMAEQAQTK